MKKVLAQQKKTKKKKSPKRKPSPIQLEKT